MADNPRLDEFAFMQSEEFHRRPVDVLARGALSVEIADEGSVHGQPNGDLVPLRNRIVDGSVLIRECLEQ